MTAKFSLLVTPAYAGDAKAEIDFVTRASIGHIFAIPELGDNKKLKALAIRMIPVTEAQLKKAQALSRD